MGDKVRAAPSNGCVYPNSSRQYPCGELATWESEFGKAYCNKHHRFVLRNREYMFEQWEEKQLAKTHLDHLAGELVGSVS